MTVIQRGIEGRIRYVVLSYQELVDIGIVPNLNMYIGNGYMFCANCQKYTYHFAMSHRGMSDCYELCKDCDSYVIPLNGMTPESVLKGLGV